MLQADKSRMLHAATRSNRLDGAQKQQILSLLSGETAKTDPDYVMGILNAMKDDTTEKITSDSKTEENAVENFGDLEDERERFRSFMLAPEPSNSSAPPCLRVSLKRSNSYRVGVDLFHVPHQLGEETYHLVALREDCDTRSLPEVICTEDADEHPYAHTASCHTELDGKSFAPSVTTVSQVSANSLLQISSDLQEMTLLVDPTSPLLDVEQAHLSFQRHSQEIDSTMPSLRRLVQPTDWGTIRSQLVSFAARAEGSGYRELLNMRLRLQDDCKRCVEVRHVEVSTFQQPNTDSAAKLCLQLHGLRLVKPVQKHQHELQGVNECLSEEEM